ncbi:hypothetical protein [Phocaeicola sp.]|uniref:hypothetical protein n=1 Tax=Phocaeicola sp. TaxID=2773926 RepID=UPI00307B5451
MKKLFSIMILLTCFCTYMHAQKNKLSKEEFRARQEAFITENARLTPQEAKEFFPLYFELQDKKSKYNREAWQEIRKGKQPNVSEEEYNRIVEDVIQTRITIDQLDLEYVRKYKKFLSSKKIYDIQRAEMKFHRHLLRPEREKKTKK